MVLSGTAVRVGGRFRGTVERICSDQSDRYARDMIQHAAPNGARYLYAGAWGYETGLLTSEGGSGPGFPRSRE
jgi:hypothetical protein